MTYEATIAYLFERLPMYQRIGPSAFKKDLSNIRLLCNQLGHPHEKFQSIHIAGTNGKGSVSHILSAVIQAHGYKTGLYTSPHLKDFRERIKVNGQTVSKDFVIDFIEKHRSLLESVQPSFFEITVAMAFDYFATKKVDFAIIETGLGGRLDSTNIVQPFLSVITNISLDHQQFLGDTLSNIAFEKAGIIKPNTPVVIGEYHEKTDPVFKKKSQECHAQMIYARDYVNITEKDDASLSIHSVLWGQVDHIKPDLTATYQYKNLCTTLAAIQALSKQGVNIELAEVTKGIENVRKLTGFRGRWDILSKNPLIILDCAHNEAGIKQAMKELSNYSFNNLHIIFGLVKDKDLDPVLSSLPESAQYYFCAPDIPRRLDPYLLRDEAKNFNLNGKVFESPISAMKNAKEKALPKDLILAIGSIFLIAELL